MGFGLGIGPVDRGHSSRCAAAHGLRPCQRLVERLYRPLTRSQVPPPRRVRLTRRCNISSLRGLSSGPGRCLRTAGNAPPLRVGRCQVPDSHLIGGIGRWPDFHQYLRLSRIVSTPTAVGCELSTIAHRAHGNVRSGRVKSDGTLGRQLPAFSCELSPCGLSIVSTRPIILSCRAELRLLPHNTEPSAQR